MRYCLETWTQWQGWARERASGEGDRLKLWCQCILLSLLYLIQHRNAVAHHQTQSNLSWGTSRHGSARVNRKQDYFGLTRFWIIVRWLICYDFFNVWKHFLFKLKRHDDYISAGQAERVAFACTSILVIILQCGSGLHGHFLHSASRMTLPFFLYRIVVPFNIKRLNAQTFGLFRGKQSSPKRKWVTGKNCCIEFLRPA